MRFLSPASLKMAYNEHAILHAMPGVVSTATAVKLINGITGCVNHGKLSRHDIIRSVFALLVGDVEVVQEDELLVRGCRSTVVGGEG